MALGTNNITTTTAGVFIPALWSDEVIAAYKSNLVVANLVTKIGHNGKKGDTIYIPTPTRGSASAKAASTQVTLIAPSETNLTVSINKHYEYSRLIEDIVSVQGLESYRKFYTDDAGYALAKQVDQDIHLLGAGLQGGSIAGATNLYEAAVIGSDGSTLFSGAAGSNTGNGAAIADAGIRKMIQNLDDTDVPNTERVMIIPPVSRNTLMGLARFTEQAYVGEVGGANTIRNGYIADIYGVSVYVSTNCPFIHVNSVTGTQSVTFSSTQPTGTTYADAFGLTVDWTTTTPSDTKYRAGLMLHKSALAYAEQMSVRSQTQYKQEWLADLFTADTIYGTAELRDTAGVAFVVPA
jgi:hypothetical protein